MLTIRTRFFKYCFFLLLNIFYALSFAAPDKHSSILFLFKQLREYIVQNEYNDLGQLIEKNLHSNIAGDLNSGFKQSIDYAYNIRGWLKSINNAGLTETDGDLFGMELMYNDNSAFDADAIDVDEQFNGNISGMQWRVSTDAVTRAYGFDYDEVNRLNTAKYAEKATTFNANENRYSVGNINYDLNGNIENLWRQGENSGTANFTYGYIDKLDYSYIGNTLIAVNDTIDDFSTNNFSDGQSNDVLEYAYDVNGNMIRDDNKGIINIKYNYLNLPEEIDFGGGKKILYLYAANGTKLEKQVIDPTSSNSSKTYAGSFIYNDNGLEYALFEEGRLLESGGTFEYQYFLKDHLGNTRVTFSANDGLIKQQDHFYPFGMSFSGIANAQAANTENFYRYNGKELQDNFGLNWYDYGARMYDAQLGRFMVQDRFAEKYYPLSPYQYAANNAISNIDINGDSIWMSVTTNITNPDGSQGIQTNRYYYGQDADGNNGFLDAGGNIYSGTDAFVGQVTASLQKLSQGGTVGEGLVNELMSSTKSTEIYQRGSNKADAQNGNYILWNPDGNNGGPDQNGGRSRDPFIGLGHEMAHIQDVWNGTIKNDPWVTVTLPGGQSRNISKAEIYSTHMENQIRSENNLPLRVSYGINAAGGADPNTRIVKQGTSQSVFYGTQYYMQARMKSWLKRMRLKL